VDKEIELFQDGGQKRREKDIYHHGLRPICHLSDPPLFLIGHYLEAHFVFLAYYNLLTSQFSLLSEDLFFSALQLFQQRIRMWVHWQVFTWVRIQISLKNHQKGDSERPILLAHQMSIFFLLFSNGDDDLNQRLI
jgi:hypothetical protein